MAFFLFYKHLHLLIGMFLVLFTFRLEDNNLVTFKAEGGRVIMSKTLQPNSLEEDEKIMVMGSRRMVGSRPPKCERSCGSCGPCQPVQVPIAPLLQLRGGHTNLHKNNNTHLHSSSSSAFPTNHDDGISNYKPICWKCKCGNFIFNP